MRIKLLNALKRWSEDTDMQKNNIIIRYRKKIHTETVKEWHYLYKLSRSNEKMIVDFENFTTQELMYLSKRIKRHAER